MKKRVAILSALLAVFGIFNFACVTTSSLVAAGEPAKAPILNSERIKQKFGSYGVEVIPSHSPLIRLSKLYSVHDTKKIGRTIAITTFAEPMDASLLEGFRLITQENQSIGSTFKDLGWTLKKRNLFFGTKEFKTACLYKMMDTKTQPVAIHIYQLLLCKADKKNLPFATIAELQHPDYLTVDELKSIYGDVETSTSLEDTWKSIDDALNDVLNPCSN